MKSILNVALLCTLFALASCGHYSRKGGCCASKCDQSKEQCAMKKEECQSKKEQCPMKKEEKIEKTETVSPAKK